MVIESRNAAIVYLSLFLEDGMMKYNFESTLNTDELHEMDYFG